MMNVLAYLAVFAGGGLGACLRFALARWATNASASVLWATLAANLLACLLLGYLAFSPVSTTLSSPSRWFWAAGFCGGLSTFSTFSLEAYDLLVSGKPALATLYVLASLAAGMLGLALSYIFYR